MRRVCALFVLLLCRPALGDPARETPKQQGVQQVVDDAERAYHDGDYLRAAQMLEEVFRMEPNSRLLFNIARAYEKAGRVERAIAYYERYAASQDAEAELVARATKALAGLREEVRQASRPAPAKPHRPAATKPE